MRIEICIPTLNRTQKLLQTVGSIAQAKELIPEDYVYCYIYYSNKEEFEKDWVGYLSYPWILMRLLDKPYNASEFWNDHIKESHFDVMLYLNDDIILHINCLKNIVDIFNIHFPDLDGIVGIRQSNLPPDQALQTAFGAIGDKFADRFPDRQVFMPKYSRFYGDRELYEYSTKINKLYFDEKDGPELQHFHPSFYKDMMDETYKDVRKHLTHDKLLYTERHNKGLLWGENFEL